MKSDYNDDDFSYDPSDWEEEKDNEECSCGYYCFDCLGMSWADFI